MTPWTIARQAPQSMRFPKQGYWSGLPFPSPGDLPDPGIEPESLTSPALGSRFFYLIISFGEGFPGGSMVKNLPANAGNSGSIPGSGRSPGEGNGNSVQYSCLENPMDRGVWQATVHEVTNSWTQLSDFTHSLPYWFCFSGESQGQRSQVGYSPWGLKESDTTEAA